MMIGETIGSYKTEAEIGEGGWGKVYRAVSAMTGEIVAIKMLKGDLAQNAQMRWRFQQEAQTLSRLNHPNIVKLIEVVESNGDLAIVMEYVDGQDLDQFRHSFRGPLPPPICDKIFGQLLNAFGYAHSQNVIHRDIKPSNFMVTADGNVKVLDFGLAKIMDIGKTSHTKTGAHLGTVSYMSPEIVHGYPADSRSDIYSLGVTLFVLATGKHPYEGFSSEFQIYTHIVQHPLPSATEINPALTTKMDWLIAKATAKNPADRFQTCEEFARGDIASAITAGIDATKITPDHPILAPYDRKVRLLSSVSIVAGFGLGIITLVWWGVGVILLMIGFGGIGLKKRKIWSYKFMRAMLFFMMAVGFVGLFVLFGAMDSKSHYDFDSGEGMLGGLIGFPSFFYSIWGLVILYDTKKVPLYFTK